MGLTLNAKAKSTLAKICGDNLSAVLIPPNESDATGLTRKAVDSLSASFIEHLFKDVRFVECIEGLAQSSNTEWLTTEDAARLSGFSRPFIISLLDGKFYSGRITYTPKGHRRLDREDFVRWMESASKPSDMPKTIQEVRTGPRDSTPVAAKESPERKAARTKAKAASISLAKSMGIG